MNPKRRWIVANIVVVVALVCVVGLAVLLEPPEADAPWLRTVGASRTNGQQVAVSHLCAPRARGVLNKEREMYVSEPWTNPLPPERITRFDLPEAEATAYREAISGNKLGGTPGSLQGDELPSPEPWHLLLQLDSATVPFWINLGDTGIRYAFLNRAGTEGKFLPQCC